MMAGLHVHTTSPCCCPHHRVQPERDHRIYFLVPAMQHSLKPHMDAFWCYILVEVDGYDRAEREPGRLRGCGAPLGHCLADG